MADEDERLPDKPRRLVVIALWVLFCVGLALQAFSPHLSIKNNAFVIPDSAVPAGSVIDPRGLVLKERTFQGFSAALVITGAIGLAFMYRGVLSRSVLNK